MAWPDASPCWICRSRFRPARDFRPSFGSTSPGPTGRSGGNERVDPLVRLHLAADVPSVWIDLLGSEIKKRIPLNEPARGAAPAPEVIRVTFSGVAPAVKDRGAEPDVQFVPWPDLAVAESIGSNLELSRDLVGHIPRIDRRA